MKRYAPPFFGRVLRAYFRLIRYVARRGYPAWVTDAKVVVRLLPVVILTFIYSNLFPEHFYRRISKIANFANDKKTNYPYMLRPIPYAVSLFLIVNALFVIDEIPLMRGLYYFYPGSIDYILQINESYPRIVFNVLIFVQTLLLPIFTFMSIIAIIASVLILIGFLQALPGIDKENTGDIDYNTEFFGILFCLEFWRGYDYRGLFPRLMYYSVNMCITFPLALMLYFVFWDIATELFEWILSLSNSGGVKLSVAGLYAMAALAGVWLLYILINPLLYILFYGSRWFFRKGLLVPSLFKITNP